MITFILIFAGFIALIFIIAGITDRKPKKKSHTTRSATPARRELTVSEDKFNEFFKDKYRPEYRQGKEFKIAGLNHRKNLFTYGNFEGYVKPEIDNPYDEYAIGIYSKFNEELVGYLPKSEDNKKLFNSMLKQDVLLYTSGYISEFIDENGERKLYGRIYLDID